MSAARSIVVEHGPEAATVSAIAKRVGAPVGSVYHRFRSRDVILATVLLDEVAVFQAAFIEASSDATPGELATRMTAWIRANPSGARLLGLYRPAELMANGMPEELAARALTLRHELDAGIRVLSKRWLGTARAEARRAVRLAIMEVPLGALRPLLRGDDPVPRSYDALIAAAADAVIEKARTQRF
ncbi:MAG: helix-turn-helix domain-containing protein [Myxococcota bacterium]